eukprot:14341471-Heterocapsa_arctica.AAC.1
MSRRCQRPLPGRQSLTRATQKPRGSRARGSSSPGRWWRNTWDRDSRVAKKLAGFPRRSGTKFR